MFRQRFFKRGSVAPRKGKFQRGFAKGSARFEKALVIKGFLLIPGFFYENRFRV